MGVEMADFPRIAVLNTGWSVDYRGGQVVGDFGYLEKGVGHERYNFRPDSAGRYFGYAPPLGESQSPPKPAHAEDWLVFFVSKRPGRSGLYLVGWYENATFAGSYKARPDADDLGIDSDGGKFSYTVSSSQAYPVPLPLRTKKIKGDHLKRSYAYLRGNGDGGRWREELATELLLFRKSLMTTVNIKDSDDEAAEVVYSGDPERRKLIEREAVDAVTKYYSEYHCESKEKQNLGYDLLFRNKESGEELHVEVKGTALGEKSFFISRNEYEYATKLSANDRRARRGQDGRWRPLWRLAIVHDALAKAVVSIHTFSEMEKRFEILPIAWRGVLKSSE
jgi:Domain of unknown function (DUF3883)